MSQLKITAEKNQEMMEDVDKNEAQIETINQKIEEQVNDNQHEAKIKELKWSIEELKQDIRDINIREGMIRTKLETERQRAHNSKDSESL